MDPQTVREQGGIQLKAVTRAGGATQPEAERHRGRATVTYQRATGALKAQFADRKVAIERGAPAQTILETLPESARAKLMKGKAVSLSAQWESQGNARKLVVLSEP